MEKDSVTPTGKRAAAEQGAREDFGRWLAQIRRPLSQADLARATKVSTGQISNVEAGRRTASDAYLKKVAAAVRHSGGLKHMQVIRTRLYCERMRDFVAEELEALARAGVEEGDSRIAALREELIRYQMGLHRSDEALSNLLAALATGEAWDPGEPDEFFEAGSTPAETTHGSSPADMSLSAPAISRIPAMGPASLVSLSGWSSLVGSATPSGSSAERSTADADRAALLTELWKEAQTLQTPQLLRVLGYVDSLRRTSD